MTTSDDVQAAVDRLGETLGRAVLVEDPRHRPLWWSRQGTVDGTRMRTILEREVHPAAIAMVAQLGLARATGPIRVPAVPEAEMLARWCLPLRGVRDLLGYLWVLDPDYSVTEVDPLVECASLAAAHLAQQRSAGAGRAHRRAALLALLAAGEDLPAARELIRLEGLRPGNLRAGHRLAAQRRLGAARPAPGAAGRVAGTAPTLRRPAGRRCRWPSCTWRSAGRARCSRCCGPAARWPGRVGTPWAAGT